MELDNADQPTTRETWWDNSSYDRAHLHSPRYSFTAKPLLLLRNYAVPKQVVRFSQDLHNPAINPNAVSLIVCAILVFVISFSFRVTCALFGSQQEEMPDENLGSGATSK